MPGVGTVLKKWFGTKEAPKHLAPIITIKGVSKQSQITGYFLLKKHVVSLSLLTISRDKIRPQDFASPLPTGYNIRE